MSETVLMAIVIVLTFIICTIIFAGLLGNIIKRAVYDAIVKIRNDEECEQAENEDDEETKKYIQQINSNK
jgi:hypothetical protein